MSKENDPYAIRASMVLAAIEELSSHQKKMAEMLMGHADKFKEINARFDRIDEKFDSIDSKFVNIDGKLAGIDKRLISIAKMVTKNSEDIETIKSNYARRSDLAPLEHRVVALERKAI